jgi:hypothetical protein
MRKLKTYNLFLESFQKDTAVMQEYSIYDWFEDLKSDHVEIEISNNTFANNLVFGFKNYNISTNYIYGRADQVHTRFNPKIENNSFVKNFLVDNISDTIVHSARRLVYNVM